MTDCKEKCWCRKIPTKKPDADKPPFIPDMFVASGIIEHIYDGIEKCFQRIKSIEAEPKITLSYHDSVFERIKKLENYMEMEDRITACDVLQRLSAIEEMQRAPHKCPVCKGLGNPDITDRTAYGPRRHLIENDPCNSCKGTGILWG